MKTYFKSFVTMDNHPVTTTYDPTTNSRKTCQTLGEVLETGIIAPNTTHSKLEKRLCASHITPGYSGTYRPEGLVFETEQAPNYVVPFDMMALTRARKLTSADYNSELLSGSDKFRFESLDAMLQKYPNHNSATKALNDFRAQNDLPPVDSQSLNYNECCFTSDVKIKPVAIIGQSPAHNELATKYNVPRYNTIGDFEKSKKPSMYDFTRKSVVGALFRVGASFAIDGAGYLAVTGGEMSKFFDRFQWDKFASVTAAVVAINFVDYKWDITNKLDSAAKKMINGVRSIVSLS